MPLTVDRAIVKVRLGRLNEAIVDSDAARDGAQLLRDPQLCLWSEIITCIISLANGQPREALAAGARATALAQTSSNVLLGVNAHLVLALAQLQAGDPAQARRRILENAGGPDLPLAEAVMRPHWHGVLAQAELSLARREAAEDWTRRAETSAQGLQLPSATAHAELARATLLLADGDADNACALALRAGQRLRSIGAAAAAGRSDVLAGRALALAGRRTEAIERLQHAHAQFATCGAKTHRDEAARELRRLGSPPRRLRSSGEGVSALSNREREVADLAAGGLTNREIAQQLYLSEKTVETHITRILNKLDINSRIALAAILPPIAPSMPDNTPLPTSSS